MKRRLETFFRHVVYRYQADLDVWMEYFNFCLKHHLLARGSKMLNDLMQVNYTLGFLTTTVRTYLVVVEGQGGIVR